MRVVDKKTDKPFWIVWCPARGKSQKKYSDYNEAVRHAELLAHQEKETFYVMEAKQSVGFQITEKTTRTNYEGEKHE